MGVRIKFPGSFRFLTTLKDVTTVESSVENNASTMHSSLFQDIQNKLSSLEISSVVALTFSSMCALALLCVVLFKFEKCIKRRIQNVSRRIEQPVRMTDLTQSSSSQIQPPIAIVDVSHNSTNPLFNNISYIEPPKPIPPFCAKKRT